MTARIIKFSTILLCMALILSACSFSAPFSGSGSRQQPVPEASPEPETVTVPETSFTPVSGNTAQLIPLTCSGNYLYCVSQEKTGEAVPDEAVKAAAKKKKTVVNDGRYDTFAFVLYKLCPNGTLHRLPAYESVVPEENTAGWSDYASVVSVDALQVNDDSTFTILEHTATSGNSMPENKAEYQPGKDYLEYVLRFYLRTLNADGSEKKRVEISAEEAENLLRTKFVFSGPVLQDNAVYQNSDGGTEADSANMLFSLTDAGIDPSDVCSTLCPSTSGGYRMLCGKYDCDSRTWSYELAHIKLKTVSAEEHTVLKLGYTTDEPSAGLLSRVADFNRNNTDISVHPVALVCSSGIAELVQQINDNQVDIIYTDNQTCTDLSAQGMTADLYPYLDNDEKLNRENYLDSVLSAAERNGSLCSTCAGFTVSTVIAAADRVGDRCCWTYDELREAWGALGIGTDAFDVCTDREAVFRACLRTDLSSIVSYNSETAAYLVDSDRLSALQWFCGNFPASFDPAGTQLKAEDATDLRIRNGKQLLLPVQLYSFDDLKICGYAFDGEISFIGYPTLNGCGSTMTVTTLDHGMNFSLISSGSQENNQAAWQFLRTFFTASYQTERYKAGAFFPSMSRCFEIGLRSAMSGEYAVDKNGELVYDKNNNLIHVSLGSIYLSNYTEVRYYPVTEQRGNAFRTLVNSITKTGTDLPDSQAIIEELCRQYLA